ncbi:MAG: restriction endonuclease subunit S [Rhodopseudomonas sp.]|uniref:restriction endonuclease subunit S n=1 Tax=Rhodopseudomonas sp. TaxID=1078 RepID=UPI0039E3C9EE
MQLSDVARLESGHTPSKRHPEYWGGDVPWIGIRDAKAHHGQIIHETLQTTNKLGILNSSARILPEGTVCLSRTASVGYVVTMGRPMATSQDFANWICSEYLDRRFLAYLFLAEQDSLLRFASGAIHQTIYYPELKALHICLPPLAEQQRVIAILDDAFADLANAAANATKNINNAHELFDSYLSSIFLRGGEDWRDLRLRDVVISINTGPFGSLLHKSDYVSEGIPVINPINIQENSIVPDASKSVTIDAMRRLWAYQLSTNDIILGRRGEIGRCAVVRKEQAGWLCGTGCFFIKTGDAVNAEFLAHLLRSVYYSSRLEGVAKGATMKNLSNSALQNLRIVLPPVSEQKLLGIRFGRIAEETRRVAEAYKMKLASLDALRKSVLNKAFSGELTAPPLSAIKEAAE